MKTLAAVLMTFGLATTASVVHADTVDVAIGNTIVVRYSTGEVVRYYFNEDQTFTATWSEGEIAGTWEIRGEKICIDMGDGDVACDDYPKDKDVGDSWTEVDDDDGTTMTISIEAGR